MFKCIIFTDAGTFEVNLAKDTLADGTVIETALDAWQYVKDTTNSIRPFVGSDGVFSIEKVSSIKAIKVEEFDPLQPRDSVPVAEGAAVMEAFSNFAAAVTYLGQDVQIHGLKHTGDDGFKHFMPMMVNGQTPYDVIDKKDLETLLIKWAANVVEGGFRIVMPPVGLDPADALDYLTDYMREVAGAAISDGKDAKAWDGWTGEK